MAKPKDKKDPGFREWLQELAESKITKIKDPERRAALERVLAVAKDDEETEEALREIFRGGLREFEFHKRLNALHEIERERGQKHEEWKKFRDDVETEYNAVKEERDRLKHQIDEQAKALERVGLIDDAAKLREQGDDALATLKKELDETKASLKQHEEAIMRVSAGAPTFMVEFVKSANKYRKEGFEFDEEDVYRSIVEAKGSLPVALAFEDAIREQRDERKQKELDEKLKKAKEEGRQEALTQKVAPDALRERLGGIFGSADKPAEKLAAARAEAAKLVSQFGQPS